MLFIIYLSLILEFCLDVTSYLLQNPKNSIFVHCNAGKGRSGLMIICYLIFSELLENSHEAQKYYSARRSSNGHSFTLSSQKRYALYFQKFLEENFRKPYLTSLREYKENPKEFVREKICKLNKKLILKFMTLGPFKSRKNAELIVITKKKMKINLF